MINSWSVSENNFTGLRAGDFSSCLSLGLILDLQSRLIGLDKLAEFRSAREQRVPLLQVEGDGESAETVNRKAIMLGLTLILACGTLWATGRWFDQRRSGRCRCGLGVNRESNQDSTLNRVQIAGDDDQFVTEAGATVLLGIVVQCRTSGKALRRISTAVSGSVSAKSHPMAFANVRRVTRRDYIAIERTADNVQQALRIGGNQSPRPSLNEFRLTRIQNLRRITFDVELCEVTSGIHSGVLSHPIKPFVMWRPPSREDFNSESLRWRLAEILKDDIDVDVGHLRTTISKRLSDRCGGHHTSYADPWTFRQFELFLRECDALASEISEPRSDASVADYDTEPEQSQNKGAHLKGIVLTTLGFVLGVIGLWQGILRRRIVIGSILIVVSTFLCFAGPFVFFGLI